MDSRALMATGRFKLALDQINKSRAVDNSLLQDKSTAAQTTRVRTSERMTISAAMKLKKQESVNKLNTTTNTVGKTKKKALLTTKKKTETNMKASNISVEKTR